jgi:hypothetical protein
VLGIDIRAAIKVRQRRPAMPFGGGKAAGSLDGHALPSLAP